MTNIEIRGWQEGFLKVSNTELLQKHAGLSLAQAKAATDSILEGNVVSVLVQDETEAKELVAKLSAIGALASITPQT